MLERDTKLLESLAEYVQRAFAGTVHRVVWADRNPLQGSSAPRGRWNSPDSGFEVLNTSLDAQGAAVEFEAFWSLFEQRPTRAALNWKLRVRLGRVVELDFEQLDELGVRHAEYANRQYSRAQHISDGLCYSGCEGLIVPSARHDSKNPGRLHAKPQPGVLRRGGRTEHVRMVRFARLAVLQHRR